MIVDPVANVLSMIKSPVPELIKLLVPSCVKPKSLAPPAPIVNVLLSAANAILPTAVTAPDPSTVNKAASLLFWT